jgi:hypothetical protein
MMPRFFKDIPKDKNEKGKWKIEVLAIFPMKETVLYSSQYEGKKWKAYVKIRLKAWRKDISTPGYYGIGWRMKPTK